jgi:hypothetical protein
VDALGIEGAPEGEDVVGAGRDRTQLNDLAFAEV